MCRTMADRTVRRGRVPLCGRLSVCTPHIVFHRAGVTIGTGGFWNAYWVRELFVLSVTCLASHGSVRLGSYLLCLFFVTRGTLLVFVLFIGLPGSTRNRQQEKAPDSDGHKARNLVTQASPAYGYISPGP